MGRLGPGRETLGLPLTVSSKGVNNQEIRCQSESSSLHRRVDKAPWIRKQLARGPHWFLVRSSAVWSPSLILGAVFKKQVRMLRIPRFSQEGKED